MSRNGFRLLGLGLVAVVTLSTGCGGGGNSTSPTSPSAAVGSDSTKQVTTEVTTDGSAGGEEGRRVDPCELFSDTDVESATGQQGLSHGPQRDSLDTSKSLPGTCVWSQSSDPVTAERALNEPASVFIDYGTPGVSNEPSWDYLRKYGRNPKPFDGPCDPDHAYMIDDAPSPDGVHLRCGVGRTTIDVTLAGSQATAVAWLEKLTDAVQ